MTLLHPNADLPPPPEPRKSALELLGTRWGAAFVAVSCAAALVYYLAWVAPALVPVPPGTRVPYPQATRFLEVVCTWCGTHQAWVVIIAAALLIPGLVATWSGPRQHLWLALLMTCVLAFTYLSISAPVDRLVERVRSNLSVDRQVPDFLPGHVREKR
jgi:hypothetical protein